MLTGPLARVFLASACRPVEPHRQRELERTLEDVLSRARAAWPQVALDDEAFIRHLAERLPDEEDALAGVGAVRIEDLYLACALAAGDRAALRLFETHVLAKVSAHLARGGLSLERNGEAQQRLRERLLVPQRGRPARIAGFTGRGSLVGWVRMAAARITIDMRSQEKPGVPLEGDAGIGAVADVADLEIDYLKRRYGRELRETFQEALHSLPPREAAVLRLHFLDGMSARSIGVAHRVHERTVQKWLAAAREQVLEATRRLLRERLQLEGGEVESMIALVQSQMSLNLSTFFKQKDDQR